MTEIGRVRALYRYPVKAMAGERVDAVEVGWHGLDDDRRYAFLRERSTAGFPWINATRLPALARYRPLRDGEGLVTRVVAPDGRELDLHGDALRDELSAAYGEPVRLVRIDRGIFDEAAVSVLASATAEEIGRLSGVAADERRFRPNVVVELAGGEPFGERTWAGRTITFRDPGGPALAATIDDVRCSAVNLDPDTGAVSAAVLKAIVRANDNVAGAYAAVVRCGRVSAGDPVLLA